MQRRKAVPGAARQRQAADGARRPDELAMHLTRGSGRARTADGAVIVRGQALARVNQAPAPLPLSGRIDRDRQTASTDAGRT